MKKTTKLLALIITVFMMIAALTACNIFGDGNETPDDGTQDGTPVTPITPEDPCKNGHTYDNTCDSTCNVCDEKRTITHTPEQDDGDCTTTTFCTVCDAMLTEAAANHLYDTDCDTDCNNAGCKFQRIVNHTPVEDDGDCTTAVLCTDCGKISTPAKEHFFDNTCDTSCNNEGCNHIREITHTSEDDGDCTTAVLCSVCGIEILPAKDEHVFDDDCDTSCNNDGCTHTKEANHIYTDDGDCTTAVICTRCESEVIPANPNHSFDDDCDADCNSDGCNHTRVTHHNDLNDDGNCEICGNKIPAHICDDIDKDGQCDECGSTIFAEGQCKNHPEDEDNDGICDGCGNNITLLPWAPL